MGRNLYANAHPAAVVEIKSLVEGVAAGDPRAAFFLKERLGTVDGVYAFANVSNVAVQEWFAAATPIWNRFSSRSVVGDFRAINWLDTTLDFSNFKAADKGVTRPAGVIPKVAEGEKYQNFSLTSSQLGWAVEKFGAAIGFTWEHFVNDQYNTVSKMPAILSGAAGTVHDANATRALYLAAKADSASTLRATTVPAVVPVNAPLTFDSLEAARAQLVSVKRPDGSPANSAGARLALNVGPGQVPNAERILSQTTAITTLPGGQFIQRTPTFGNIDIVENPYLDFYAGNTTSWVLSVAPGGGTDTILTAFLAGEESPEVRVSGLAGYAPNGGALPFTSGSFDTDTFDMRVRVVGGAGAVSGGSRGIVISDGDGQA